MATADFNPFSNPQRQSSATRTSFPFLSGPVPEVQQGAFGGDAAMKALLSMFPQIMQAGTQARQTGMMAQPFQMGPIGFERSFGPGGGFSPSTRVRSITGGFAPGTIGATFESMLPRILASLTGAGGPGGLPTRESLLDPRLADIEDVFGQQEQALLSRFAGLGRDVTGSVPTEALRRAGTQKVTERQRAMGDVDTLLAQLGIQQQGAAMQRLQAIMQMMAALGMGGR